MLPTRNLTRPRTNASVVRGKLIATDRTSSIVRTSLSLAYGGLAGSLFVHRLLHGSDDTVRGVDRGLLLVVLLLLLAHALLAHRLFARHLREGRLSLARSQIQPLRREFRRSPPVTPYRSGRLRRRGRRQDQLERRAVGGRR